YERIEEELDAGRQAFVVCPLVEASEALEARAATEEYERLKREVFPGRRLELLHGRMTPREEQDAMLAFAAGGADILAATAGLGSFRFARMPEDAPLLSRAREHAKRIADADPQLAEPEHALLAIAFDERFGAEALAPIPA